MVQERRDGFMTKKIILVAEDDVMLSEISKFRLESLGYDVIIAENGKEGAFKAMSEKPDLMLVDIMMPEVSGIEMIKIVRANSDLKDVPIIVVSALGRNEDIEAAMKAGANDYVVKPYSSADLVKRIANLLK
ncbi:MAG: response regulator [Deltaproteobacteria bacterium CG11_big_fil_rev_8_21_14_0_20_49_13]|nr:MAG: response regulator [Deltaproteobacteria bacterium CG11_big_fil_rev_8_21_14_0_20_49_13]